MRCPMCGKEFNPRKAMMDEDWLKIFKTVLPTFGHHAKIAFEYVELFGANPLRGV